MAAGWTGIAYTLGDLLPGSDGCRIVWWIFFGDIGHLFIGHAGADSEPGKGSTFWFTVWLTRGHGVYKEASASIQQDVEVQLRNQSASARLLLVEDNEINREVAIELLSGVGLDIETAENGKQAVEKVRLRDYDLVLLYIILRVQQELWG